MRRLWAKVTGAATLVFWIIPGQALAAGGGGGEAIVFVADSRRYSGWKAWFTNLYNESHLYFMLVTIITIPALALILGSIMSFLIARTGIDLKSRVLAEH
jgi:hypothetical protein